VTARALVTAEAGEPTSEEHQRWVSDEEELGIAAATEGAVATALEYAGRGPVAAVEVPPCVYALSEQHTTIAREAAHPEIQALRMRGSLRRLVTSPPQLGASTKREPVGTAAVSALGWPSRSRSFTPLAGRAGGSLWRTLNPSGSVELSGSDRPQCGSLRSTSITAGRTAKLRRRPPDEWASATPPA
jgi:hypothetical protein